ncbi:hypothetical protein IEQ34_006255 [Dendrobium chrysotoxum]|uniref:Uncharacterized protein n=1 Tax=Dendrobium chrysotoxum TaxID=161865 RepID=A0AAV7HB99_DENCH|nr:hypothetical protein IEQ34_006255 [Dendrobium chrysotoxum]
MARVKGDKGVRHMMQNDEKFITLSRYAPKLVSTPGEECHRFLRGSRDSLRHPLIPFQTCISTNPQEIDTFWYK